MAVRPPGTWRYSVEALHPTCRATSAAVMVPDASIAFAALILMAGQEAPSEADLVSFLRTRLTAYQIPVRFMYVDDFPRTSSLKPAIPDLRLLLSGPD